jgi:hypothetical protein
MVTLWILIIGFKSAGGSMSSYNGRPTMQPLANYATEHECDAAAKDVHDSLQAGGVGVNTICLPTGVSDPLNPWNAPKKP